MPAPEPRDATGALVLSLDFELRWGVRDSQPGGRYDAQLMGGRLAIPRMLELFESRGVSATWATVGFLFARDKAELLAHVPEERPTYRDRRLSPYEDLDRIGEDEEADPLSFAPSLIDRIAAAPRQELATHTFSHFYPIEQGQTAAQFKADMQAAARIGARYGDVCRSLVVPRNQWNPAYSRVLDELGVRGYRVNRDHWAYRPTAASAETRTRRAARLLDTYLPLSGAGTSPRPPPYVTGVSQPILASHFLRPYAAGRRPLERIRLRRLGAAMEQAARRAEVIHLWWHPHNFGAHMEENLDVLDELLERFERLRRRYGMRSMTMGELVAD